MLVQTNTSDIKRKDTTEKILSADQKTADASISIRITSEQLQLLKIQANKEKRSISNFIKSKLF